MGCAADFNVTFPFNCGYSYSRWDAGFESDNNTRLDRNARLDCNTGPDAGSNNHARFHADIDAGCVADAHADRDTSLVPAGGTACRRSLHLQSQAVFAGRKRQMPVIISLEQILNNL